MTFSFSIIKTIEVLFSRKLLVGSNLFSRVWHLRLVATFQANTLGYVVEIAVFLSTHFSSIQHCIQVFHYSLSDFCGENISQTLVYSINLGLKM